ncbi:MAG TPA: hypothetical protein VL199_06520 [Burkholderiales bacterium]|jgi:hypothetical protein|nr:hypothetical protein [Burkholderiales bacterium]
MNTKDAKPTAAWTRALAVVAILGAAGCAQMSETECRAADWYQIGHADGDIYGIRPRIDQLAYQCQAFGVQAQEPIYIAGWVDGYREYLIRMNGSECCGSH